VLPQAIPNFQHNTPPRVARFKVDPMAGLVHDSILQGYDNDDPKPFLCMPGVKAYHRHPAHTGDSWWLHKGAEGSMHTILHALWKYGVRDIVGQNLVFQVVPAGYVVQPQVEQVAQMVLQLAAQAAPAELPAEGGPR
jgi:hypothetical protein